NINNTNSDPLMNGCLCFVEFACYWQERFATDVGEPVADGNSLVADELMMSAFVDTDPPLALLH
ncbi:unnamed protein product, partial [Onchocerca ochengi]